MFRQRRDYPTPFFCPKSRMGDFRPTCFNLTPYPPLHKCGEGEQRGRGLGRSDMSRLWRGYPTSLFVRNPAKGGDFGPTLRDARPFLFCRVACNPTSLSPANGGANFVLVDDGDPSGITSTRSITSSSKFRPNSFLFDQIYSLCQPAVVLYCFYD